MDELIAQIEEALPDLRWLVRSTDASDLHIGGAYFAHICNAGYSESYQGVGDSAAAALGVAFDAAKQARAV